MSTLILSQLYSSISQDTIGFYQEQHLPYVYHFASLFFFPFHFTHTNYTGTDHELKEGGGGVQFCFARSAGSSSFCDFFLFSQNKGGGHLAPPLGLPTKLRINGGAA